MGTKLRITGMITALLILAVWLINGPNLGWTKTSIAHKQKDPVTEIEVDVYTHKFVPGIDFLAVGLLASSSIFGFSFLFKNRSVNQV